MKAVFALALIVAVSACGSRQHLKPAAGKSLPPKPYAAKTVPTPEQLMTPSNQARPQRIDELLTHSEKRQPDPFNLPPPG
ncbi:MAG: argininosuccinate lyase [Sphingomonadales bacterium]|nr:argininosuccinate lyase [Sphingomonadales bacterium]